jgi:hypothetical protein
MRFTATRISTRRIFEMFAAAGGNFSSEREICEILLLMASEHFPSWLASA